jgi:WD40 repeat protein
MRLIQSCTGFICDLRFTHDPNVLMAVWGNARHPKGIQFLDAETATSVREFPIPFGEMAVSPGLTEVVRLGFDVQARPQYFDLEILDLINGGLKKTLPLRLNLTSMAFSPDSQVLIVAGVNYQSGQPVYEVARWLWRNSIELQTFPVPWAITALAMSNDRKTLIAGGLDNAVRFWRDSAEGNVTWKHKAAIRKLLLAQKDDILIAAAGCSVSLWDMQRQVQIARLRPHRKQVNDIAISPDERRLATASNDGSVRVWDLAKHRECVSFDWGIGKVGAVAFSPDGLTLAAGGEDGRIVIWDAE